MRAYVRDMAKAGVDSIKFLLSSDEAFKPNGSQTLTYTEEEVAAIGDEARKRGVWLACHAQAAQAVKLAVKHGFRIVYHCAYADEEALDMLERATQLQPGNARAYYVMGILYDKKARPQEAAAMYRKAREVGGA